MLCCQRAHDGTIEDVDTMKTKPVGDFRPYLEMCIKRGFKYLSSALKPITYFPNSHSEIWVLYCNYVLSETFFDDPQISNTSAS